MARLNERPSIATVASSAPENSSDQENHDPTPRRDKGKGRASSLEQSRRSLPTPSTDGSELSRGQKRKRVQMASIDEGDDDSLEQDADALKFNKYFDPNQNPEIRRQVKRKSRAIERDFLDNRDQLLRDDGDRLRDTINQANGVFQNIKQTNDATVDSRLFVNISDIAYKRTQQIVLGDKSAGIDVDHFLSLAIAYMRHGPPEDGSTPSTQTQRRRQRAADDEDDEDVIGEPLDFEVLGQHVCFPYNSRPACPSFLLGPLSVEKRQRKLTQRSARQTKDTNTRESRPEAISKDDLARTDENTLTKICSRIHNRLSRHCVSKMKEINQKFPNPGDQKRAIAQDWFKEKRIRPEGGPWLFDYVVNPQSFGQTVENIFYISFLIKENVLGIMHDNDGQPLLIPREPVNSIEEKRRQGLTKRQAILALDYETWEQLIQAYDIQTPMIEHRQEEQPSQIGQRGWYA